MFLRLQDSYDIPVRNGELRHFPDAIPVLETEHLFDVLLGETPWLQDEVLMYGKRVKTPRLSAWYGDRPYQYSGLKLKPKSLTPLLCDLKLRVEKITSNVFNSVLLNFYRDGADSMSWHSDDEIELGKNPAIASLNLGGTRRFRLRRKDDHKQTRSIELNAGSVLLMAGALQHFWQHSVPKTKKPVAPRMNLTFRHILQVPFE